MKLEDGEINEDAEAAKDLKEEDAIGEGTAGAGTANLSDKKPLNFQQGGWSRRDGYQRAVKTVSFIFTCIKVILDVNYIYLVCC